MDFNTEKLLLERIRNCDHNVRADFCYSCLIKLVDSIEDFAIERAAQRLDRRATALFIFDEVRAYDMRLASQYVREEKSTYVPSEHGDTGPR